MIKKIIIVVVLVVMTLVSEGLTLGYRLSGDYGKTQVAYFELTVEKVLEEIGGVEYVGKVGVNGSDIVILIKGYSSGDVLGHSPVGRLGEIVLYRNIWSMRVMENTLRHELGHMLGGLDHSRSGVMTSIIGVGVEKFSRLEMTLVRNGVNMLGLGIAEGINIAGVEYKEYEIYVEEEEMSGILSGSEITYRKNGW